jgi:hypothetical protein
MNSSSNGYYLWYPNEDFILYPAYIEQLPKTNNPLAFWIKNLQDPRRGPLVSTAHHSRTLARLSYTMCYTLAFWLHSHIESAPLSHYGLIIAANVPHSRTLARLLYQMYSILAFWPDFNEHLQILIYSHPASSQHQASIQPAFSQHPASIQPPSNQHSASIKPVSSQHPASIQPASNQHSASIKPVSSQHPASIQPASNHA